MTTQAKIQSNVWRGYAKAAQRLGTEYRFTRRGAPFPDTELGRRMASINPEDMTYSRPDRYGKATCYVLADGTGLKAGDYFRGAEGTYFIASLRPLLPILAVQCNRVATFARTDPGSSAGARGYGGMTAQNETPYASNVPCSILQGVKGEKAEAGLPADTRVPWWAVLVPASVGSVRYGDVITDDLARRHMVSSAELTDLGYRLTASLLTV